jgi:hypothetical protein
MQVCSARLRTINFFRQMFIFIGSEELSFQKKKEKKKAVFTSVMFQKASFSDKILP